MAANVTRPAVESEIATMAVGGPKAKEIFTPAAERLVSLDAFRGFIMFWIIGGEALMIGLQALGRNPIMDAIVYQLNHSPWRGLRFYDCIWPSFMLMAGVSVPLSFAKRSLTQTYPQLMVHALKRFAVLFLLGSVRESVSLGSPYLVELSSALQPIAIASFVAFLLVRKSWRFQAMVGGLILAGYALLLAWVSAPGIPAGTYLLNHNLVHSVDIALLGRVHWDRWPYAPEGWGTVLSTIPTISTTILGLLIGELLMSARSKKSKIKIMGAVGLSCLALGWGMSPVVPVIMKLWTTSYGLVSAGWACLMLVLFYWVIDVRGYRKWAFPFVMIGMNPVFIYMFASIVPLGQWVSIFTSGIAEVLGRAGPMFHGVLVLMVEWFMLFWMYKRKIFLRA